MKNLSTVVFSIELASSVSAAFTDDTQENRYFPCISSIYLNEKYIFIESSMQNITVSLENLGAIQSANLEIKPLTVFIGKNNTGKTWVAETIAGLLDTTALRTFGDYLLKNPHSQTFEILNTISDKLLEGQAYLFDLVKFISASVIPYFEELSAQYPKWMNSVIGTNKKIFDAFTIKLVPTVNPEFLDKIILDKAIDESWGIGENFQQIRMVKKAGEPNLLISLKQNEGGGKLPHDFVRECIHARLLSYVHAVVSNDVYYLPAERTGLVSFMQYMDNTSTDNTFTTQKKNQSQRMEHSSIRMAQPILMLYDKIKQLQRPGVAEQFLVQRNLSEHKKFIDLANLLEEKILDGSVIYETRADITIKELRYVMNAAPDISLELPAASSTVKDMVPLVLYLKYYLHEGNTVFIDEPEMNLHPENQAKFMEFLTILVHAGIHILMVTHSPYMLNHLDSLMIGFDSKNREEAKKALYLDTTDGFISKDNVSVYEFRDGSIVNLIQEDGLNLQTFDEVTNTLSSVYMKV